MNKLRYFPFVSSLICEWEHPHLNPRIRWWKLTMITLRKSLTRLPLSNAILFGIHTYQNTLEHESSDPARARDMLNVLRTTPPEMMKYKAIVSFENALLNYLESRASTEP